MARNRQKPITEVQGIKFAQQMKAAKYVECSIKTKVVKLLLYFYSAMGVVDKRITVHGIESKHP